MSIRMPSELEGFMVQRSDFPLFTKLCRQRGIAYRTLNIERKNMVIVDMEADKYVEVETEILSRRRQ